MAAVQLVLLGLLLIRLGVLVESNNLRDEQGESLEDLKLMVQSLISDQVRALRELRETVRDQGQGIKELALDLKTLHASLSHRLENSERKVEWAITDGSLAPRNTSWVLENFRKHKKELDWLKVMSTSMSNQLNQSLSLLTGMAQITIGQNKDCAELYVNGVRRNGVYSVYPKNGAALEVYCDMTTQGGGWTVLQRRYDGSEDFYRAWDEYAHGFGEVTGEHWLGLNHVSAMTFSGPMKLFIGVTDFELGFRYQIYSNFRVYPESQRFRLRYSGSTGNAGDSLRIHNNRRFSTRDRDNDNHRSRHCSVDNHGAWWYRSCGKPGPYSNLNGRFSQVKVVGEEYMTWWVLRRDFTAMKDSVMMIRPATFTP